MPARDSMLFVQTHLEAALNLALKLLTLFLLVMASIFAVWAVLTWKGTP